ncbi:zinc finger protein 569-like [Toxorhynchites rutilus septentrionalis]|uniref:zinc finger protein 569-like n=1 Tax=Toxorhynchites rutilus septentrionalis TaxID=329112 RepID=UPI002479C3C3|nr:zinc finger protein 569-like [Toxorhynchites rutilus septentrionalis]
MDLFCSLCYKNSTITISTNTIESELDCFFKIFKLPEDFSQPKLICSECLNQLEAAHKIYQQILQSLENLKCVIGAVGSKSETSPKTLNSCDNRDKVDETEIGRRKHEKPIHQPTIKRHFYCEICRKIFKTYRGLLQHSTYCHPVDTPSFRCDICFRDFISRASYTNHLKHHHDFICKFCSHGWVTEKRLLDHVRNSHKDRLFRCKHCPKTEKLKKCLNRHVRTAHGIKENLFFCGHCSISATYIEVASLTEHMLQTHASLEESGNTYEELLNETFFAKEISLEFETDYEKLEQNDNQDAFLKNVSLMRIHTTLHSNNAPKTSNTNPNKMILEEFLDEAFENDQIWTKYIEGGEEYLIDNYEFDLESSVAKSLCKYRCPQCSEGFIKQHHLTVHLAEIHNISCLICNDCGASYNKIQEYRNHRQEHLKDNVRFRENIIPEAEEALSLVRKEKNYTINEVGNNYSFTCSFCSRTFHKKCNLKKHVCLLNTDQLENCDNDTSTNSVIPRDAKSYENLFCTLCDKKFSSISGLKYHLKRHTDTKAFPCQFCNKKFTANSNLNSHIRNVHSDYKSYGCSECDKRFAGKDHLTKHIRSKHRQERSFVCLECPKSYYQKSHLNDHIAAAHTDYKSFICQQCNSSYSCRGSLRRHMTKVHKVLF